ncbi:hypothetical protein DSLASN_15440 [Desulfoluna limicola]|uniref:Outer membrane protein beta-barrel domain-containing protein n=1 Tax=Desulfoluna limicola TaxID=2810562 RepID=A0ABM7PE67_9BACT|nr:hypothetical protein [Desulfoluna limicola]BCS95912.1 hypothetical protein DSLASN_15440 [Desulfoluna limicola]
MHRCPCVILFIVLLIGIIQPPTSPASEDPNVVFIEMGGSEDPKISGIQAGFGLYDDHTALLAGLSLLGSATNDDLFTGINMGVRFHPVPPFDYPVTPFIGLGGFVGYSWEEANAEDDDIDNDEDGEVDEEGETKTTIKDTLSAIYPEVGLHVDIMGNGLLTLAARYNVTTQGRDFDHWLYTLAFSFPFSF